MSKDTIIYHISDLHFVSDQISFRDHFSKRALGYYNFKWRRKKHFDPKSKILLIEFLQNNPWDFLFISGDLSSFALEQEFADAYDALKPILKKNKTFMIPGNHDRYIRRGLSKDFFQKYFHQYCDLKWAEHKKKGYSIKIIQEGIVLISVDMSVPNSIFSSKGKLGKNFYSQIQSEIQEFEDYPYKLVMGHYPIDYPEGIHEGHFHKLSELEKFKDFLIEHNIDFYFHGHIHKSWALERNDGRLKIINSGGSSYSNYSSSDYSGFHKITLSPKKDLVELIRL